MKKTKIVIAVLAVVCGLLAVIFEMRNESTLVFHPKGVIAHGELNHMVINILCMLVIIIPTFIWLLVTAWKYQSKNTKAVYEPERTHGVFKELLLWIIPSLVVVVMAIHTWYGAHELDPSQPIKSTTKPMTIQVVALDWKWLFIYPEQGIASLNFVQFPAETPIQLKLASDGSPMNSFWLPQMSGQIYAMSGMVTTLHIMANAPGVYHGRAAEINGDGYADMTFVAKSTTQSDFDEWVASAKKSPLHLSNSLYTSELTKRSKNDPVEVYSNVEANLFDTIVMKYMHTPVKTKL